ncbi:MAG: hypothetical protein U0Q12_23410 [Vicinamibacterales bacterium]
MILASRCFLVTAHALAVVLATAAPVAAQEREFLFSLTTTPVEKHQASVSLDVGLGERDFTSGVENGVEQRLGLQARLSRRLTLVMAASLAMSERTTTLGAGHAELLASLRPIARTGFSVAVGGGVLREFDGTSTVRARLVSGHTFGRSRVLGNLLIEKPLATGRDRLDLISSVGWLTQVTRSVHLGIEGVAEDLEGFWQADEAEGGARLLVGPTMHIGAMERRWRMTVGGGPVFVGSASDRASGALRQLQSGSSRRGYTARVSWSYLF